MPTETSPEATGGPAVRWWRWLGWGGKKWWKWSNLEDEREGDFWFMHLVRWRCCYSDKKHWRKGQIEGGQFWTLASEMTGRHLSGDSRQVTGELRERDLASSLLHNPLVSLLSHLFPIHGKSPWITMFSWLPDPVDDFQSHLPQPLQHLTQLATLGSNTSCFFCDTTLLVFSLYGCFTRFLSTWFNQILIKRELICKCIHILISPFKMSIFVYIL